MRVAVSPCTADVNRSFHGDRERAQVSVSGIPNTAAGQGCIVDPVLAQGQAFCRDDRVRCDRESCACDGEGCDGESCDCESADCKSADRKSADRKSADCESADCESADCESADRKGRWRGTSAAGAACGQCETCACRQCNFAEGRCRPAQGLAKGRRSSRPRRAQRCCRSGR